MAARTFAFWDLSKSKTKDFDMLKDIARYQSPININTVEAVYNPDVKINFNYKSVHVDNDKPENPNHGHLVLDVEHLGHIEV